MSTYRMKAIGVISTPYKKLEGMPVQPGGAQDSIATVTVDPKLQAGLLSLEGFSHIYLIYQFHQSSGYSLLVEPFMDDKSHGVFATRAPRRPNPLGLSIVRLISVRGNELTLKGADILDGTPILDIKPYVEQFDKIENASSGWITASRRDVSTKLSDHRFLDKENSGTQ